MKKVAVLLISVFLSAIAFGDIVDIQFSPGGSTPGNWVYDGASTISFTQVVDIDAVEGATTDALFDQWVYIPDLILSSGYTVVTPSGPIEIKDSSGNLLLSGTLAGGDFVSFFTIAATHTEYTNDIVVTYIDNSIGSDFLDTLSVGTQLDFNITMQFNQNFSSILGDGQQHSNGFSGSMDVIPEPATIALLGLGGLLLRKRR